jgi:hypothetical protein
VCDCDSFCCDVTWDQNCATQNSQGCGAAVQCAEHCAPVECPVGTILFDNPPDETVDARQPHEPDDEFNPQGMTEFIVQAPDGANRLSCWSVCDTDDGAGPNSVNAISVNPGGGYVLHLARPVSADALTAVTYTDDNGGRTTLEFIAHSANVNADAASNANDVVALALILRSIAAPPWGIFSVDLDRRGAAAPADLLRAIDLLMGGGFDPSFDDALPAPTASCPPP